MDLYALRELFRTQTLSTSRRPLRLAWDTPLEPELGPVLMPQRAVVSEGLCAPTLARITCLSTGARLPLHEFLGLPVALQMVTDRGALRSFPLLITEAALGRTDGALTAVHLVGRDAMSLLEERRRLRTFRNASVPEVVSAVLDDWKHQGLDSRFTYTWLGAQWAQHPQRACFIQHPDESDTAFVQRLLRDAGIAWYWRAKEEESDPARVPRQELVLFDDGRLLPENVSSPLRHHRREATGDADTIDLLAPLWRLVPDGLDLRSWDHETGRLADRTAGAGLDQGGAGNALARALREARVCMPHQGDSWDDLQRQAQARADHLRFRARTLHGRSGVRTLAPGTWQRIEGHPGFGDAGQAAGEHLTVSVEHLAQNNLPVELEAAAQALIGDEDLPAWARDGDGRRWETAPHRYANRFLAVPRGTPVVPPPLAPHELPRLRPLTGIVIAPGGGEMLCDGLGRSCVQLLGGEPGADTTAWIRHRTPWSGSGVGFSAQLRAGTEVDIEWIGPDRPVIAGCHFNGDTPPPRVAHQDGLPHNFAQTALVGRELGGTRQQYLLLDDTRGQQMAQLAGDAGHSALSLGELTTPRHRGQAEPRGRGAELRSDDAGAIRMGQALLLSTHGRPAGTGHQLAAEELQAQLDAALAQAADLGALAAAHQAGDTDTGPQRQLRDQVAGWGQGGGGDVPPVLALDAAAGLAAATPASATLQAGRNIDVVATQHAQISAGKRFAVRAAEMVSLFAHRLGMRLVAAMGAIRLLALKGPVEIGAGQDLHLYASGGQLVAEAAGGLVLRTRGVEVVLKDGRITLNGQALEAHAASFNFGAPVAVAAPDHPLAAAEAPYDQRVVLTDMNTGLPAAGRRYRIRVEDGQVLEGVTDAQGYTQPVRTALSYARFTIELLD